MNILNYKTSAVAFAISSIFAASVLADEQQKVISTGAISGELSGNFRLGYISTENENGDSVESSAIGGELSYSSASWH